MRGVPTAERFWAKVRVEGDCWVWTAGRNASGYGVFSVGGRQVLAHRWAFEHMVAEIPVGLHLDHVKDRGCSFLTCVRPDHLEPVTPRVNNARSESVTARNARLLRCKRGHPFTRCNTYVDSRGYRHCRCCGADRKRKAA